MAKTLSAEDVERIRRKLGWTREQLADFMEVTPDAVKKWENESNPCRGTAAKLLVVLERCPGIPALLERPAGASLPPPDPPLHSDEWFALQRLLGLINQTVGPSLAPLGWTQALNELRLTHAWIVEATSAGLLSPLPAVPEVRLVTELAKRDYELELWVRWCEEHNYHHVSSAPVLDVENRRSLIQRLADEKKLTYHPRHRDRLRVR